jgi:hypothetical protein
MHALLGTINFVAFLCLAWGFLGWLSQTIAAEKPVYEKPQGWDSLVEAAKREGTVVLYVPPGMDRRGEGIVAGAFTKSFPSINLHS